MKLTEQIERLQRCAALLREVRDVLAADEWAQRTAEVVSLNPRASLPDERPLSDAGEERLSLLNVIGIARGSPGLQIYLHSFPIVERRQTFKLLLRHFGVPGTVKPNYPETFLLQIDRGGPMILEVWNVPRPFKIECDIVKNCVAVFPDGRRMPLAEAEKLEAEAGQ